MHLIAQARDDASELDFEHAGVITEQLPSTRGIGHPLAVMVERVIGLLIGPEPADPLHVNRPAISHGVLQAGHLQLAIHRSLDQLIAGGRITDIRLVAEDQFRQPVEDQGRHLIATLSFR